MKHTVSTVLCKDCKYYIPAEELKNDPMYDDYENILNADGLCMNTDKWADKDGFCSDGKEAGS